MWQFTFADYVSVVIECDFCGEQSPDCRDLAELIVWAEEHEGRCEG